MPNVAQNVEEIGGLSSGILHALAALLTHFAPHTVAYKVGNVVGHVADASDEIIPVGAAVAVFVADKTKAP